MTPELTQPQAKVLLGTLEGLRRRPEMYIIGKNNVEALLSFLYGMFTLCSHLTGFDRSTFLEIAKRRGWQESPRGVVPSMREAGLSEEEIVKELIEIEIAAYKQLYHL